MTPAELWNQLVSGLSSNQFLQGGAVLAAAALIFRKIGGWAAIAWDMIYRSLCVSITITNDDAGYEWLKSWLDAQPSARRIRSVMVSLDHSGESTPSEAPAPLGAAVDAADVDRSADQRPRFLVTPGLGTHIFFYRHRLLWLSRTRSDSAASSDSSGMGSLKVKEQIDITFLARNRKFIQQFLDDVRDLAMPPTEPRMSTMVFSTWGGWRTSQTRKRSDHRNVILDGGVMEELERDILDFKSSRPWYEKVGIPWRRGFIFEGIPGSGKTSTAMELAIRTGHDLAIVNLGGTWFDDNTLMQAIATRPRNSFLLFEDIDAISSMKSRTEGREGSGAPIESKSGVTLSGFLNAIDGVMSIEGTILFMTTNHPEMLDEALVRPGRVDRRIEFTHASTGQIAEMFRHFFPDHADRAIEFAEKFTEPVAMCGVQEHLIRYRRDPDGAVTNACLAAAKEV